MRSTVAKRKSNHLRHLTDPNVLSFINEIEVLFKLTRTVKANTKPLVFWNKVQQVILSVYTLGLKLPAHLDFFDSLDDMWSTYNLWKTKDPKCQLAAINQWKSDFEMHTSWHILSLARALLFYLQAKKHHQYHRQDQQNKPKEKNEINNQ